MLLTALICVTQRGLSCWGLKGNTLEADLEKNILLENNAILGIAKHEHKARVSLNKDKTKRQEGRRMAEPHLLSGLGTATHKSSRVISCARKNILHQWRWYEIPSTIGT